MGFFSWNTQDTNKSICNAYSGKKTFIVYMMDNKGNVWKEKDYQGYGEFGGKDFYELLAEMNNLKTREEGIKLSFGKEPYNSPNLVKYKTKWKYINKRPEMCEYQGYFYDFFNN